MSKKSENQVSKVVDLYHEICKSYPKVRAISEKRKKGIRACLKNKQIGLDGLKEAFEKAERNKFLKGEIKSGNSKYSNFKADFDWLTNENNVSKILNGKYDRNEVGGDEQSVSGLYIKNEY